MSKLRVHEYAKQINKTSKEVIEELGKLNVQVTNHMSTLEGDAVSKLDSVYKKSSTAPKQTTSTDRPQGQNTRPQGDRPQGQNTRPQGDRPQGQNTRPQGDRPQG